MSIQLGRGELQPLLYFTACMVTQKCTPSNFVPVTEVPKELQLPSKDLQSSAIVCLSSFLEAATRLGRRPIYRHTMLFQHTRFPTYFHTVS